MASVSEQISSRINFGSIAKADDLKKRILFTLLALIVYRIGSYVPIPGIDPVALEKVFERNVGGILGMFDMFAGGALGRMTIFALNIMPYISASIIMQLLTSIILVAVIYFKLSMNLNNFIYIFSFFNGIRNRKVNEWKQFFLRNY